MASLAHQVEKTEQLLEGGFALTIEMKKRKIQDMQTIDEQFDALQKKLQLKKAQLKKAYNDAFTLELSQVNAEQENFEKHLSLVNFSRETVVKTAQELEQY